MNYSFEYIDIILLAMIAGFIYLRLRAILGKRTGFEGKIISGLEQKVAENIIKKDTKNYVFNDLEQKAFLKGAKIAYETIITELSKGSLKNIKSLLDKSIFEKFSLAVQERENNNQKSETIFVGINEVKIVQHENKNDRLEVIVDFNSEIISSVKDKDGKILSGDPEKVKKVHDTWKFARDTRSKDLNWVLIDTDI